MKNSLLAIFVLTLFLIACSSPKPEAEEEPYLPPFLKEKQEQLKKETSESLLLSDSTFSMNYDFGIKPKIMNLALALKEISGLTYFPKTNQLLAVNDELGFVYFLNPENGEKEKTIRFGGNGDYEGIEIVGGKLSVIKSNGDFYYFDLENYLNDSKKKGREERIKTKLSGSNDVEGLAYDSEKNKLLIACKGNPNLGKSDKYKKVKNIYSYDLGLEKLDEKPFLSIADSLLENFVEEKITRDSFSKKEFKKLKKRAKEFSPSGIAIHPISKKYYLLSSQGKTLLIFNIEKALEAIIFLDTKEHAQPEGICFLPSGTLFISNEGKGMSGARLMKYDFFN